MTRIRQEIPADVAARERLLDEAFGPARREKTCERLRERRLPARGLSFVAEDAGQVVGTLRLWHVTAGPRRPALLLGPLAVATSHRALGIGARLMMSGLGRARLLGHESVLLVGDAPYYGRFGFEADLTRGLWLPGPVDRERFLGLELQAGSLAGAFGFVSATGEEAALPDLAALLRAAAPQELSRAA
jgi:predicted N-acetyltransferase YhbS